MSKLNYPEYCKQAHTTAIYAASDYPFILLIEELGELGEACTAFKQLWDKAIIEDASLTKVTTLTLPKTHTISEELSLALAIAHNNIIKELGDIEWCMAECLHVLKLKITDDDIAIFVIKEGTNQASCQQAIASILAKAMRKQGQSLKELIDSTSTSAGKSDYYTEVQTKLLEQLLKLLNINEVIAEIYGVPIDVVRQTNLDKLASRKERSVIDGSGNAR